MANERWSINEATFDAGAGVIFLDFSPINHRPFVDRLSVRRSG